MNPNNCKDPHLGLATNQRMLDELAVRIEMGNATAAYRTVSSRRPGKDRSWMKGKLESLLALLAKERES